MAKGLPKQSEDFPAWYQEVVKQAGMAEHGLPRGSMVIKPWGFAIWEHIQRALDDRFKATGHENVMFPMLIPEKVMAKEAAHVEGFAHEFWTVTHGGGQELEEKMILRPTSEAVIWNAYSNWIQSYRDLPLLYNQWCNVLRWELRTRLFLRTSEFLWQEGHTAHSTSAEAFEEARRMHGVYQEVAEDVLGIPVLAGRKSPSERFPGADETFTIEAMMRDGKALQSGTSHYLGQNFSKAYDVTFLNADGEQEYAYGTSWGWSTRTVGAVVMAHGDDKGLRLPPAVAPVQVVIVPIYRTDDERSSVLEVAGKLREDLAGNAIRVKLDTRDQHRPGFKFSEWELKGVPIRIEIGPKDVEAGKVVVAERVGGTKRDVPTGEVALEMSAVLRDVQTALRSDAQRFLDDNTFVAEDFDGFVAGIEAKAGFWSGAWCGDEVCEQKVTEATTATIRALPSDPEDPSAPCLVCGRPGTEKAVWAKAY